MARLSVAEVDSVAERRSGNLVIWVI
jgi:hypothetical protein